MGKLVQVECWEKHPSEGVHWFIMTNEIGKGTDKGFGKTKWNFWHIYL